jgi:hypothetical protein
MVGTTLPRWSNYFFRRGDDFRFWRDFLTGDERNILFIVGLGFDPRTCQGLKAISQIGGSGKRDCIIIQFDEGPSSPSAAYSKIIEDNGRTLQNLFPSGKKSLKPVAMWSPDNRRIGSRNAANIFASLDDFSGYSDIVVDVSAMPRGLYFPLIGKILYIIDSSKRGEASLKTPNLHVLVSENAQLDSRINYRAIDDEASYMYGFTGALDTESASDTPKVWIPILGEKQTQQLERIYNLVIPDEICPMLPMPSTNPRRTDNLLVEYRELLFDRLRVDQGNFIYVDEQNPFEVYSELHRAIIAYNKALSTLGGCQVVISALASKLLSLGALLAVYELKDYGSGVGIAHVETNGYIFENAGDTEKILSETTPSTLWLAGDCYAR